MQDRKQQYHITNAAFAKEEAACMMQTASVIL